MRTTPITRLRPDATEYQNLTTVFGGIRVAQSLVFCVVFGRSLFVIFLLAIALSVL